MQVEKSIEISSIHQMLWSKIDHVFTSARLSHAFLFIGASHAKPMLFANRLVAKLLCQAAIAPCGVCKSCRMVINGTHPDLDYVLQESEATAIKIDQIRLLQQNIYQTPLLGTRRCILISPADKLNIAASNALLKILEEPPAHTTFILLAENVTSIPLTIRSRCQVYQMSAPVWYDSSEEFDYLDIGRFYPASSRGELYGSRDRLIKTLADLILNKVSVPEVALLWSEYSLGDLVWFLYLFTMQLVKVALIGSKTEHNSWRVFTEKIAVDKLFHQLDKINVLSREIQQNIPLNQNLAIESILLGYLDVY